MDEGKDGTGEPRSFTRRHTSETCDVMKRKRSCSFPCGTNHTLEAYLLQKVPQITLQNAQIYCICSSAACKRWMCSRAPLVAPSRPHLQQLISKDEMWVFVCKLFWVCTRAVAMATAGKKQQRRAMREVVRWGVEAIIGEGWRGHVLCTSSRGSCSGCWGFRPAASQVFVISHGPSRNPPHKTRTFGFPVPSLWGLSRM